jgi:hypothetical protein
LQTDRSIGWRGIAAAGTRTAPIWNACTAAVITTAMQTAARFGRRIDPDQMIAGKLPLTVHLGTYEAATERILGQLIGENLPTRSLRGACCGSSRVIAVYQIHRRRLLDYRFVSELCVDMTGTSRLAGLHERGSIPEQPSWIIANIHESGRIIDCDLPATKSTGGEVHLDRQEHVLRLVGRKPALVTYLGVFSHGSQSLSMSEARLSD